MITVYLSYSLEDLPDVNILFERLDEQFELYQEDDINLSRKITYVNKTNQFVTAVMYFQHLKKRLECELSPERAPIRENVVKQIFTYKIDFWLREFPKNPGKKGLLIFMCYYGASNYKREALQHLSKHVFLGNDDRFQMIQLNLHEIGKDYPEHWLGSFSGRSGAVRTGTLSGDDVARDPEFGSAYQSTIKNQLGIKVDITGEDDFLL